MTGPCPLVAGNGRLVPDREEVGISVEGSLQVHVSVVVMEDPGVWCMHVPLIDVYLDSLGPAVELPPECQPHRQEDEFLPEEPDQTT